MGEMNREKFSSKASHRQSPLFLLVLKYHCTVYSTPHIVRITYDVGTFKSSRQKRNQKVDAYKRKSRNIERFNFPFF